MSFSRQSPKCSNAKSEPNCNCASCKEVKRQLSYLTQARMSHNSPASIQLGARVLVRGKYPGSIRYIGDLDSNFIDSKLFIGVKLDDPVGKHDGIHHGKRFFKCPPSHGMFVPIEQVQVTAIPGKSKHGYGSNRPRKPPVKPSSSSNDHISTIPMVGSQPSSHISVVNTIRDSDFNYTQTTENSSIQLPAMDQDSSSSLFNRSSLFAVRPKTAHVNRYQKRDGATAPTLRDLSPISMESSKRMYFSDDGGKEIMSLPSLTGLNLSEQSALKLPPPPHNEMNTKQWRHDIQTIKADPNIPKLYMSNAPIPPVHYRECFAKEGRKRIEERDFVDRSRHIQTKDSYSSRLLSGLPKHEMAVPLSADDKLKDVEQFGYWLKKWGGGVRGWTMATTVQKLKDAKRQGDTEMMWQEKIDKLESEAEFSVQVKRIKKTHRELFEMRTIREQLEREIRLKTYTASHRPPPIVVPTISPETIVDYRNKTLEEEAACFRLEETIRNHRLISNIDSSSLSWLTA